MISSDVGYLHDNAFNTNLTLTQQLSSQFKLSFNLTTDSPPCLPSQAESPIIEWTDTYGNVCAVTYQALQSYWMHWPGVATFRFKPDSDKVLAWQENGVLAPKIVDLFWRSVIPFILQTHGFEALHASAVLTPQGVVAFCARSGTGKSTLAWSMSLRGYPLWSDDALVFKMTDDGITTVPLPIKLRLLPDSFEFLSNSNPQFMDKNQFMEGYLSSQYKPEPLKAIFILNRIIHSDYPGKIVASRLTGSNYFQSILEHAFTISLYEPKEMRRLINHYLDLAEKVPCFTLEYPSDLNQLPLVINQIEIVLGQ